MPINSFVQPEDGAVHGRGYYVHQGKGKGHQKRAEEAMADGEYTLLVSGINHDNPSATSQTSAQTTLADGSVLFTEVRQGSISTVDDAPANGGDTSALRLETDSNNGRLRLNNIFDADQRVTLGDLDELSFDFYVEESSTTIHAPVIRLQIDADGDLSTTNDRGELVFEYVYQGLGDVPEGEWVHADLAGEDWIAWQRSGGVSYDGAPNFQPLSNWADSDGYTPAGGKTFNENSLVLGWQVAYGSGNGTGVMYVDNINVNGVTMEFSDLLV